MLVEIKKMPGDIIYVAEAEEFKEIDCLACNKEGFLVDFENRKQRCLRCKGTGKCLLYGYHSWKYKEYIVHSTTLTLEIEANEHNETYFVDRVGYFYNNSPGDKRVFLTKEEAENFCEKQNKV